MSRLALIFFLWGWALQTCWAWELHKTYGDTQIYKSSGGKRLSLRGEKVELNLSKIDENQVREVEDTKEKMLKVIGVRDWKITDRNLIEQNNEKKVSLAGSYINSKGEKVYFKEIHQYKKDQTVQALITADLQSGLDINDKEVKAIMDRYFNED